MSPDPPASPAASGAAPEWLEQAHSLAMSLADIADEISLSRFGGNVAAIAKPDGSPVTEVDRMVEAVLRERIAAAFPEHGFLGEETGGALDGERPTWVLDPIDATKNFMRGIPVYATLIGVVWQGRSVVGVASAPAMRHRWDAALGKGARRNGEAITVSGISALEDASVLYGALEWYRDDKLAAALEHASANAWTTRGFGDFWMHMLVAAGMAEVAFESGLKPWDIAALQAIVREAGGKLTTFAGGDPLATDAQGAMQGDVITSNGLLHDTFTALLA